MFFTSHAQSLPTPKNFPLLGLCLFGAQGCGKGSQAEMFSDTLHYLDYVPGLVAVSKILEDMGPEITERKHRGEPIDSAFVAPLVRDEVQKLLDGGHTAVIFDGYPRYDTEQADDFAQTADYFDLHVVLVHIRASRDLCLRSIAGRVEKAMARGQTPRPDDLDPVAVNRRLDLHEASESAIIGRLTGHHGYRLVPVTRHEDSTATDVHVDIVSQIWNPEHVRRLVPAAATRDREPAGAFGPEVFEPGFSPAAA